MEKDDTNCMVGTLVFLDESGVNTNLTRLLWTGTSSRGQWIMPVEYTQTTTVLSSIRLNGEKAFTTYQADNRELCPIFERNPASDS